MKKAIGLGIAVLLVIVGYVYFSPYIFLNNIKQAVEQEDKVALREYIDFPLLRESIKEQLNVVMQEELGKEMEGNMFAGLATMAGNMVIDKLVDSYSTPTGVIQAYSNFNKKKVSKFPPDPTVKSTPAEDNNALDNIKLTRNGLSRFSISDPKEQVIVTAQRDGLGWKIVDVDFMEAFNASKTQELEPIDQTAFFKEYFTRTCVAYANDFDALRSWSEGNALSSGGKVSYVQQGESFYSINFAPEKNMCAVTLLLPAGSSESFSAQELYDSYVKGGYLAKGKEDTEFGYRVPFTKGSHIISIVSGGLREGYHVMTLTYQRE